MILAKYDNEYQDITPQQMDEIEYYIMLSTLDERQREYYLSRCHLMTSEEAANLITMLQENQQNPVTSGRYSQTDLKKFIRDL